VQGQSARHCLLDIIARRISRSVAIERPFRRISTLMSGALNRQFNIVQISAVLADRPR